MKILGLDETGKGDIFGPLIIAGVVLAQSTEIYKDSKKLRKTTLIQLSAEIIKTHKYFIRVVEPNEYNDMYSTLENQFLVMNEIYREVIKKLKRGVDEIIVDKFSNYSIGIAGIKYVTKAESKYQSVAAASIIAKAAQLDWFEKHPELHLGATQDASKLLKNYNKKELKDLAKLHFKPVQKYVY